MLRWSGIRRPILQSRRSWQPPSRSSPGRCDAVAQMRCWRERRSPRQGVPPQRLSAHGVGTQVQRRKADLDGEVTLTQGAQIEMERAAADFRCGGEGCPQADSTAFLRARCCNANIVSAHRGWHSVGGTGGT